MSSSPSITRNAGWTTEPDGRGTWTLLFTCVSTTLICTWSALHLNVRQDRGRETSFFNAQMTYFLLALAAPEYFVSCAIREWRSAQDLTSRITGRFPVGVLSLQSSMHEIVRD